MARTSPDNEWSSSSFAVRQLQVYFKIYLFCSGRRATVSCVGQLTIYLDEKTQKKARRAAKREGKSLSRWAREQLNEAADEGQTWPSGFFELLGCLSDSDLEPPGELPQGADAKRESL